MVDSSIHTFLVWGSLVLIFYFLYKMWIYLREGLRSQTSASDLLVTSESVKV